MKSKILSLDLDESEVFPRDECFPHFGFERSKYIVNDRLFRERHGVIIRKIFRREKEFYNEWRPHMSQLLSFKKGKAKREYQFEFDTPIEQYSDGAIEFCNGFENHEGSRSSLDETEPVYYSCELWVPTGICTFNLLYLNRIKDNNLLEKLRRGE